MKTAKLSRYLTANYFPFPNAAFRLCFFFFRHLNYIQFPRRVFQSLLLLNTWRKHFAKQRVPRGDDTRCTMATVAKISCGLGILM